MSETLTITPAEAAFPMSELKASEDNFSSTSKQEDKEKVRSKFEIGTIMLALNLTVFVSALNDTLLANAVPVITREFDDASGYVWIAGTYTLACAATSPLWTKFSDIWGRKPIILSALALFFAASIICGWATSLGMLIAGRAIQGVAGGGLFGLVMIVISDIFSVRTRSLFLGIMAFTWAIAGATGPILGGAFSQLATWRWCFYINLISSGVAFVLLLLFLDVHNPRTTLSDGLKAVDWLGSISLVGMVILILLGLDFGGSIVPWSSPKVICLIVFGVLFGVVLYINEKWIAKRPVIPFKVFANRSNLACLLVGVAHFFVFNGPEYYLPLYFQSVQEASPLRSGILTVPLTITEAAGAIASGFIVSGTGRYRELIWVATLFMTVGTGLYINLNATSSVAAIVVPQVIAGLGNGCLFDPPLIALHANVAQDDIAAATASLGLGRNLATAISLVLGGVVFQNGMALQRGALEQAGLSETLLDLLAGPSAAANIDQVALIQDPGQKLAVKIALSNSLRDMWIMYAVVAVLGLASSFLIKKHVLSREHTETKTGLKKRE